MRKQMSLKGILGRLTSSSPIQKCLATNVLCSQYFMGVGSGASVSSSGERAIFSALKQRVVPPYCLFDVGANKGQFLQLALENIATDLFSIHCFEPGRGTYKSLVEQSKEGHRIILNNLGVGKRKGEALLHFDDVGSGLASLTKRRLDHFRIDFEGSEQVLTYNHR